MAKLQDMINQMISAAYPYAQGICNRTHRGTIAVLSGYVHPHVHLVLTCVLPHVHH